MARGRYREASANETSSNEEDGCAGDKRREAAAQGSGRHERQKHCQPAAHQLGTQNPPIGFIEGVPF